MTPIQIRQILLALLGVSFLNTLVIAYPILRSRWSGWRLVLSIMVVMYGITTFLSQIESIVFLKYLVHIISAELITKLFIQGAIIACLFAPIAVFILGKIHATEPVNSSERLLMPWVHWVWKLGAIAVCYYILYFGFGFFVAWQSPAVRNYYSGLVMPYWMPFLQFIRAFIWAALAVPVIKMMKGKLWETGLAVALLYSVLMSSVLLLPGNTIMPEAVRFAHFKEILSSNFIFGWLVVWILNLGHKSENLMITTKA